MEAYISKREAKGNENQGKNWVLSIDKFNLFYCGTVLLMRKNIFLVQHTQNGLSGELHTSGIDLR